MAQQTPSDDGPQPGTPDLLDGPDAEPAPDRRRRRLAELWDDPRGAALVALLGAVAAGLSVLSEWQTTTFTERIPTDLDRNVDTPALPVGLGQLGGWGAGYLAGLFLLGAAVALTLFGPRPGRAYGRIVALTSAGMLVVLLAAVGRELGATSFALHPVLGAFERDQFTVVRGRGVWCAVIAVALLLLATVLAGRANGTDEPPDRRWRPAEDDDADEPAGPLELSVGPATPFQASAGSRDAATEDYRR
jgi:hypothetical protein